MKFFAGMNLGLNNTEDGYKAECCDRLDDSLCGVQPELTVESAFQNLSPPTPTPTPTTCHQESSMLAAPAALLRSAALGIQHTACKSFGAT